MGPLFPIAFPNSLRATAKACLFAATAALFGSCISDGPNQTGGAYLADHGILLKDPLYHVTVKGFPVDSFWTTELEPNHYNDSVLLAGRVGDFTAEPRFAFHVSDTAMIDSLLVDSSSVLRLSLGFPLWPTNGEAQLRKLINDSTAKTQGLIAFEARSWDFNDSFIISSAWGDSIAQWNRQYLIPNDSLSRLLSPTSRDTIVIRVRDAYAQPNPLQAMGLPRLKKTLTAAQSRRHYVQMRLIPIHPVVPDTTYGPDLDTGGVKIQHIVFKTQADSGSAMLRIGGQFGDAAAYLHYGPLLLFGHSVDTTTHKAIDGVNSTSKNRLQTYLISSGVHAVNYQLRYGGPATNMLNAKIRGLHVTLDRARFLDSLDAALARQGITPQPRGSDQFALDYFVPLASMSLPIEKPSLEGGFPLQFNLITSVDTLLGDTLGGGVRVDSIPKDGKKVLWYTYEIGHPENTQDEVSISFLQENALIRKVILAFSKDSARNDTTFLGLGETKQWTTSLTGYGKSILYINLESDSLGGFLKVKSFLNARRSAENNEYRDPTTGEPIDVLAKKVEHFLKPGADAINLRATGGIQALLNRTRFGTNALQDFQFEPAQHPVNTGAGTAPDTIAQTVPFPVLSVIPPKIIAGKLSVDFDLYLFPLKAR